MIDFFIISQCFAITIVPTSNFFQFKKFGVEIMKHYPVKNVLREMVQIGVMEIVYGVSSTIGVWQQEHQVIIHIKKHFLILTLMEIQLATLNMLH